MNKEQYIESHKNQVLEKYYEGMYAERNDFIINIIVNEFNTKENLKILDLAAGSAYCAQKLLNKLPNIDKYVWNDYSSEIISLAKKKIKDNRFFVNNQDCIEIYGNFDVVICVSLEHIELDKKIFNNFKDGTFFIICSPNFDSRGHFRYYKDINEMKYRYRSFLDGKNNKTIVQKNTKKFILWGYKSSENLLTFSDEKSLNEYYNKKGYDYLESNEFSKIYKIVSNNIVGRVLDICCWTGMLYDHIDIKSNYCGFDLCSKAIAEAKQKNNSVFFVHDINNYSFPNIGSFDTLYFGGVFFYVTKKREFLNKYIELFNPKRIIIQDICTTSFYEIEDLITNKQTINIPYPGLNIERKNRQILIIDL